MKKTIVVKLGGYALDAGARVDDVAQDLSCLYAEGHDIVLVHGGGPQIDAALSAAGIANTRIEGLRATSTKALEIVREVLTKIVRPAIVESLKERGVPAVGLSGENARLLVAQPHSRSDELGRVGDVVRVNTDVVHDIQRQGGVPVVSTLAAGTDGEAFNINADTAAAKLAGALGADVFILLTNVDGIYADYPDPASMMMSTTTSELRGLLASFDGGMQPKAKACLSALDEGVHTVCVANGAEPHVINRLLANEAIGTKVVGSHEQRKDSAATRREFDVDVRRSVDSSVAG